MQLVFETGLVSPGKMSGTIHDNKVYLGPGAEPGFNHWGSSSDWEGATVLPLG